MVIGPPLDDTDEDDDREPIDIHRDEDFFDKPYRRFPRPKPDDEEPLSDIDEYVAWHLESFGDEKDLNDADEYTKKQLEVLDAMDRSNDFSIGLLGDITDRSDASIRGTMRTLIERECVFEVEKGTETLYRLTRRGERLSRS